MLKFHKKLNFLKIPYIFLVIILSSCYTSTYHGEDFPYEINKNSVYIYDSEIKKVDLDSCQLTGKIGEYQINKKCRKFDGYLEIGIKEMFKMEEYYVNITIYENDSTYFSIIGNKRIITKESLYSD